LSANVSVVSPNKTNSTDNKEIVIAAQKAGTTEKHKGRSPEKERPLVAGASYLLQ
jgi:hypothetical protein